MLQTNYGESVPSELIAKVVSDITTAVVSRRGGFSDWRYTNAVGAEQLRGLSAGPEGQASIWREATCMQHISGLTTHEDDWEELGFFWATKIGGPSHGFDIEGQCVLPLLANARNKVILISDPEWSHYPAGRAHWRLLWTAPDSETTPSAPRLWLEAINCDFDADEVGAVQRSCWTTAVLRHALSKADAMQVPLSVDSRLYSTLCAAARKWGARGSSVVQVQERLLLRPSNGVVEASDVLSNKHDWIQTSVETTEPLRRALYVQRGRDDRSGIISHFTRSFFRCGRRRAATVPSEPEDGCGV